MALGTIRFLGAGRSPKEGTINGSLYNFKLFRSQNGKHIRTFYPEFIRIIEPQDGEIDNSEPVDIIVTTPGATTTSETGDDSIKIIAALVNPAGDDKGLEKVTLFNVTPEPQNIDGWRLFDKNRNSLQLQGSIAAGETLVVALPGNSPRGTSVQLSNKGGKIELVSSEGKVVDSVSYSRDQVRRQGWSTVF